MVTESSGPGQHGLDWHALCPLGADHASARLHQQQGCGNPVLAEAAGQPGDIGRYDRHSPGSEKMSKYSTPGGDGAALLGLLRRLQVRAEQITGGPVEIVVIQEAGLDGFWVHRLLNANGIESHVVDPASIAVPRRRRRAKTDAIDGETLLRTLLAWQRGEPRVCAMVVPPTPEQEDRRRTSRERAVLLQERVRHVNRIKGLLAGQGITDYEPLHKDRRAYLAALKTGDGEPLPMRLKAELLREIELIELLIRQIAEVEVERDTAVEL